MPELAPKRDDIILYKHRYSGFYETDLDSVLKRRSINSLIFTGCTTSVCVESTLRDAMFRDYTCLLLADCTAEPGLAGINHDASLLAVQGQFGWVWEFRTVHRCPRRATRAVSRLTTGNPGSIKPASSAPSARTHELMDRRD